MKNLLFLLLLIPSIAMAQEDYSYDSINLGDGYTIHTGDVSGTSIDLGGGFTIHSLNGTSTTEIDLGGGYRTYSGDLNGTSLDLGGYETFQFEGNDGTSYYGQTLDLGGGYKTTTVTAEPSYLDKLKSWWDD